MNFDEIENLSEEQVNEMYDDFLAGTVWCMECSNKASGCAYYPGNNSSVGTSVTTVQYYYNDYDYGGCAKICAGVYCYAYVASKR